jgi:hypothetical protein
VLALLHRRNLALKRLGLDPLNLPRGKQVPKWLFETYHYICLSTLHHWILHDAGCIHSAIANFTSEKIQQCAPAANKHTVSMWPTTPQQLSHELQDSFPMGCMNVN